MKRKFVPPGNIIQLLQIVWLVG